MMIAALCLSGCESKPVASTSAAASVVNEMAAPSDGVYDISQVDVQPRPTKRVAPVYPKPQRVVGAEGAALVDFIVEVDGSTSSVHALPLRGAIHTDGDEAFDVAAVACIRQWIFKPARKNGQAVRSHLQVPIEFRIE